MRSEKNVYKNAEIDVTFFSADDIVTASTASEGFDYVDQNGWDS